MNVPQLRFPEFNKEWNEKSLSELLEFKNGINASKEQYGSGVKFINVLDILNNEFITQDKIIGSVDVDKEIVEKYSVEYGDILFQRSSETREEVGSASVYLDKKHKATFGGFVIRGKKIGDYDPIFLNKLLKTDASRDSITSKSGGSTRYNVGQETLSSVKLLFPEILEQQKIGSLFFLIDEKLHFLKQKQNILEDYKKGVTQKLFSQETEERGSQTPLKNNKKSEQLRFKDTNGIDFPQWEEKKLEEVCKIARSGGTPTSTNKSYYNGDIPFLSISDMTSQGKYLTHTSNHISKLGLENSSSWIVPAHSLIYSMYASVGFVAINKIPIATSQAVLNLILKEGFDLEFMYYTLVDFQKNIAQFITTGTQGNLNAQSVKNFELKIPSFDEQIKISNFLSSIDEKIKSVQMQIDKANIWKTGLMQKMFC